LENYSVENSELSSTPSGQAKLPDR
jgi:hypothetical protein